MFGVKILGFTKGKINIDKFMNFVFKARLKWREKTNTLELLE